MSEANKDESSSIEYLDPRLLRGMMARSEAVVVDVRSAEEYAKDHIEGAVNIPADEIPRRLSEIPQGPAVVTVCNFGGARSTEAAKALRSLGRAGTIPLQGGMRGWHETTG